MVCVYCSSATKVTNSRLQKKANQVWRRRACTSCRAIFTTLEAVEATQALRFQHQKRSEPFSRETLLLSIYASLKHRKTAVTDATALTGTIVSKLYPMISNAALRREDVVHQATEVLQRFDPVAATHYKAFHPVTT